MDKTTEWYRHWGALLSVSEEDAIILVNGREIGVLDWMGNTDSGLRGVHIPGHMIDRFVPGEPPRLFLVGRVEIIRDDERGDAIASIRTINIDGLFDEENE